MKKCTVCGKEYRDDATACPVDGQPLTRITEQFKPPEAKPTPAQKWQPPSAQWEFSFGKGFGWGLPVLGGGLMGGKKWISDQMIFNDNPVPLILIIGMAVVAFVLGGRRKKAEISNIQKRLEDLKSAPAPKLQNPGEVKENR